MSDEDVPCIGICQTDEFGYCIGCGRRGESFPEPAALPNPQPALPADANVQPVGKNDQGAVGAS